MRTVQRCAWPKATRGHVGKGTRGQLRRFRRSGGRLGAAGEVSHSAPPFVRPAGLWAELGGGGGGKEETVKKCKSAGDLCKGEREQSSRGDWLAGVSSIGEAEEEYGVQSTEGACWQGDTGTWGRRNRGAKGQGQRAQVNRAGWVHGYSWHAKPAHRPSLPSNQTLVAHTSAAAVVITLRGFVYLDQCDARVASTHLTNRTIISPRMKSGMMQFLGTQIPRRRLRSSFMS